jgi:hypothetical protein
MSKSNVVVKMEMWEGARVFGSTDGRMVGLVSDKRLEHLKIKSQSRCHDMKWIRRLLTGVVMIREGEILYRAIGSVWKDNEQWEDEEGLDIIGTVGAV